MSTELPQQGWRSRPCADPVFSCSFLSCAGLSRDSLPFKAPFQPYLSYFGFIMLILIIVFNGYTVFLSGNWNVSNFIVAYIVSLSFTSLPFPSPLPY